MRCGDARLTTISQIFFAVFLCLMFISPACAQTGHAELPRIENQHSGLPGKSHALVIGIDNYDNWSRLSHAISDATRVADALEQHHGFLVDRKFNLKATQLRDAFLEFLTQKGSDPEARLLIWYAGHGTTIEARGEKIGFLVPADAPRSAYDAQFKAMALPMERVLFDYVKLATARHILIVFDSCFSGIALGVRGTTRAAPTHWNNSVRHFIAAGTARQSVFDDGLFARLFVDAISGKTPVANSQQTGYITGSDLGEYLVAEAGRRNGQEQTPVHRKLHDRTLANEPAGEFVLAVDSKRSIFTAGQAPGLSDIVNRCVMRSRHPSSVAIAKRLAAIANLEKNILDHKPKHLPEDPRWQAIPRNVHNIQARDDGLHLFYSEGGELVVAPVLQETRSFESDASETIVLQGGWLQLGNYGCVELQFNVATNKGEGSWWLKKRNRWVPEWAPWSRPLRTLLEIRTKSLTP